MRLFFDNLELFADVISDDSYHYAEILRDYHIKLKELLPLTMKMSKSTEQCSYCGNENVTTESDGVWCAECSTWESKK